MLGVNNLIEINSNFKISFLVYTFFIYIFLQITWFKFILPLQFLSYHLKCYYQRTLYLFPDEIWLTMVIEGYRQRILLWYLSHNLLLVKLLKKLRIKNNPPNPNFTCHQVMLK